MRLPSRCYVFDLDGVLLDTWCAVHESYRAVGVTMPVGAWGQPWMNWLPDLVGDRAEAVHREKNREYAQRVRHLPTLTGWEAALRASDFGAQTYLLTGASDWAVDAIRRHLWLPPTLATSVTSAQKRAVLASCSPAPGVYVDDHYVAVPHGWRFVHYDPTMTPKEVLWTP